MADIDDLVLRASDIADIHYTYTEAQQVARRDLFALIDAERRAYFERVEPYLKRLAEIENNATPHIVIRSALR